MARRPSQDAKVAEQFPLFRYEDYDVRFQYEPWPIGLKSTYPEELIRRVATAVASLQMRNRMDYTYKRYAGEHSYKVDDGSRLDWRAARLVCAQADVLSDLIYQTSTLQPKRQGEVLSEWTFLRAPFCMKFLVSCSHRGAFFECVAIARMLLEQIAWACRVDALEDMDEIRQVSAIKAVGVLKGLCPAAGPLYGWLSSHAHWVHKGHVKAMFFEEDQMGTLFASSTFKAKSLTLVGLLILIVTVAFGILKRRSITRIFDPSFKPVLRDRRNDAETHPLEAFLARPPADLTNAFDFGPLLELLREIRDCVSSDSDVADLVKFAHSVVERARPLTTTD